MFVVYTANSNRMVSACSSYLTVMLESVVYIESIRNCICVDPAGYWTFTPACCQGGEVQRPSSTPSCMVTLWPESLSCRSILTGIHGENVSVFFLFFFFIINTLTMFPRFDVGPILNQELHQVPEKCTADELGAALATKGADLVSCLILPFRRWLPHCLFNRVIV